MRHLLHQRDRAALDQGLVAAGDPGRAGTLSNRDEMAWRRLENDFDQLRLARLCAFLRRREPDDQVGYSILIYRLSDADVQQALNGPPAELWAEPQIEGLTPAVPSLAR